MSQPQHRDLADGRWWELSLVEQLGHVGSEISRAVQWTSRKPDLARGAWYRALELLDLTLADPRLRQSPGRLRRGSAADGLHADLSPVGGLPAYPRLAPGREAGAAGAANNRISAGCLPEGLHVSVPADPLILRHDEGAMVPGGGNEDLVSGIAVKGLREVAALHEDRARHVPDTEAPRRHRLIQPPIERAVEDELLLLDLLGDFPHGDQ